MLEDSGFTSVTIGPGVDTFGGTPGGEQARALDVYGYTFLAFNRSGASCAPMVSWTQVLASGKPTYRTCRPPLPVTRSATGTGAAGVGLAAEELAAGDSDSAGT